MHLGSDGEVLLHIDRTASTLFGTVMYGVQMLAYIRTAHGARYWIALRAKSRKAYPGMLDNCVGGALNSGETPLQALIREAREETSLPEDHVRENARPFGAVSYHMATNANGEEGHQPQVMYTYIIELTTEISPEPSDDEVETFELMTLQEVQDALANGDFKANCSLTWISFDLYRGYQREERERFLRDYHSSA